MSKFFFYWQAGLQGPLPLNHLINFYQRSVVDGFEPTTSPHWDRDATVEHVKA